MADHDHDHDDLDHLDDDEKEDTEDLVYLPEPQPEKPAFFWLHNGILGLYVRCSSCGQTARAYPAFFTFVECKPCGEELPIADRKSVV